MLTLPQTSISLVGSAHGTQDFVYLNFDRCNFLNIRYATAVHILTRPTHMVRRLVIPQLKQHLTAISHP